MSNNLGEWGKNEEFPDVGGGGGLQDGNPSHLPPSQSHDGNNTKSDKPTEQFCARLLKKATYIFYGAGTEKHLR